MDQPRKRYRFTKQEKLSSGKDIEQLFGGGMWIKTHVLRAVFLIRIPGTGQIRILISAPKKTFRKAIVRNRIKRQIREAYRLNSIQLKEQSREKKAEVHIGFIYCGNPDSDYREIATAVNGILKGISKKLESFK